MTMGERIKTLRMAKGLSQEELGAMVGVKKAAINKYENGLVVNLKRTTIGNLAAALDVSPTYLLGFEERLPAEGGWEIDKDKPSYMREPAPTSGDELPVSPEYDKMYERFVQLLEESNMTPYAVSKQTGITQSSLSGWKHGRQPRPLTIKVIADLFGVNVEWLNGETDIREQKKPPIANDEGQLYPPGYDQLNDANRAIVNRLIADLAKGQSSD